ncbi:MAG TPA: DUF3987 domain-containing protein, partial [Nostocaceae cyanobacterium]|nr:DUF3987 domain-containing protein [Nostocaceae cyanobacterium]
TPTPTSETLTRQQLLEEVDRLIEQDLPKSELELIFPELAARVEKFSTGDIRRLYEIRQSEKQQSEDCQEVSQKLPNLLQAQQAKLDPTRIFYGDGGELAYLLITIANAMPIPIERLITTLIPAAGSRIGTSARIVVDPENNYTQPAVYWSCIVAPTGHKKTPTQRIILNPLLKLEEEAYKDWEPLDKKYKEELKLYKKSSGEDPPQEPPPRARFMVQSSTPETRIKIHAENPRGLLCYTDEWSGFINSRNMYRGGKGNDLELDLSEFNGDAVIKDTASERLFLGKSAISRTGGTQPDTLKNFLAKQNFEDGQGEFARWLFCLVPSKAGYLDLFSNNDGTGKKLENKLYNLYRNIGLIAPQDYFFSFEAKKVFQDYHNFLTDAKEAEANKAIAESYSKLQSYLSRLALWVHVVNHVLAGVLPGQIIDEYSTSVACEMVGFYLSQIKLLYNSNNSALAGNLLKVKECLDKHPDGLNVRWLKTNLSCLKKTSSTEITEICNNLVSLGLARVENKKYFSVKNTSNTSKCAEPIVWTGVNSAGSVTSNYQQLPAKIAPLKTDNLQNENLEQNAGTAGSLLVVSPATQTSTQQALHHFAGDAGTNSTTTNEPQETTSQNESVTALTVGAIYEVYKGLEWIPCYLLQQNNSECYF